MEYAQYAAERGYMKVVILNRTIWTLVFNPRFLAPNSDNTVIADCRKKSYRSIRVDMKFRTVYKPVEDDYEP